MGLSSISKTGGKNKENNGNNQSSKTGKSIKICQNKAQRNRGSGGRKKSNSSDRDKESNDKMTN